MKKGTKIVIIACVALVIAIIPLYPLVHVSNAPTGYLQITGNVDHTLNMTVSAIEAMPPTTITATLVSSGNPQDDGTFNYTGVTLWSLLQRAGVPSNASSVGVFGSDGYQADLTIKEIENNSQIIMAYKENGQFMKPESQGGYGPLRLIVGTDTYAERWVYWVVEIQVN